MNINLFNNIVDDDDYELFFVGWLTYEQAAAVFPEGSIVRKPHHHDFPRCQGRLKSYSYLPKKNCFICFNESPLNMIKNAFCFTLKAFLVLKIFKFLSWIFGHVEKKAWLERCGWFQIWCHNLVNNFNMHIAKYLIK